MSLMSLERVWIIPFPKFGNGKGITKFIPKIWEQEGHKKSNSNIWKPEVDDKNPFPKFGTFTPRNG